MIVMHGNGNGNGNGVGRIFGDLFHVHLQALQPSLECYSSLILIDCRRIHAYEFGTSIQNFYKSF